MPNKDYDVDWYFVKMEVKASYVLTVPAQSKEEALREACRSDLPAGRFYDVEKTVVSCGASCNDIVKRAAERSASRGRKQRPSPTT